MATKQNIIDLIASQYTVIGTESVDTDLTGSNTERTFYRIPVLEFGKDSTDVDIVMEKNIVFVVYDEGGASEKAALYKQDTYGTADRGMITQSNDLINAYRISIGEVLLKRVRAAMQKTAMGIITTNPSASQVAMAVDVLQSPDEWISLFAAYVGANTTIQSAGSAATDSDILFVVGNGGDAAQVPWVSISAVLFP